MDGPCVTTGKRVALALVGVAATFVLGAIIPVTFALVHGFRCGGDGGSPYAARSSEMGKFCEGGGDSWTMLLVLPVVFLIVLGLLAVTRGSWTYIGIGLLASILVLAIFTVPYLSLETECTAEQREANRAAQADGTRAPPFDCETY